MRIEVYIKDRGLLEDYGEVDMVFTDTERAANHISSRLFHQWIVRVVFVEAGAALDACPILEFTHDKWRVRGIRKALDGLGRDVEEL